jgi:hypothetical protein
MFNGWLDGYMMGTRLQHWQYLGRNRLLENEPYAAIFASTATSFGFPRIIQACGSINRARSANEGIVPKSSMTYCSPIRRTGTSRPSALKGPYRGGFFRRTQNKPLAQDWSLEFGLDIICRSRTFTHSWPLAIDAPACQQSPINSDYPPSDTRPVVAVPAIYSRY